MADAIARLLDNPDEAKALGVSARRRFQSSFTLDITIGKLRRLLIDEAVNT